MSQMQPQEGAATETQKNEINEQLSVIYANMAACHLKKHTYERAIDVCNKALKFNAKNTKATFRRGQAKLALGDLTGAETDFESLGEGGKHLASCSLFSSCCCCCSEDSESMNLTGLIIFVPWGC